MAFILGLIGKEKVSRLPIIPTISAILPELDLNQFDLSSLLTLPARRRYCRSRLLAILVYRIDTLIAR